MVKEISTFGSCSSRNIFTNSSNLGYKKFFHINFSVEAISLISLMSDPVEYDSNLLDSDSKYDNRCVTYDFEKLPFLDSLKNNNNLDYLVIDTTIDALFDVIVIDDNHFVSDTPTLMRTSLKKSYEDYARLSIQDNYHEYMDAWTNACDSFFKFIHDNCDGLKVILNCSRPVYKHFSQSKNMIIENHKLKRKIPTYHTYFRDIIDTYILKNYDVYVLPFDDSTLANENHVFGLHPTHYEKRYYKDKTKQINEIIKLDNNPNLSTEMKYKIRESMRNDSIKQFENRKLLEFQYKRDMGLFDVVFKYLTARFDIKNEGDESNAVDIVEISDEDAFINFPRWFSDKKGKGLLIESKSGNINFKIQCLNDGNLFIRFMGIHMKERVPIYIKFTNITINGEKINDHNLIVSHNDSFIYKKEVEDSEIITINATWVMF